MPANVVKSKKDEKLWSRAKAEAEKGDYKGDSKWKVTMSIFKNMKKNSAYPGASRDEVDAFLKSARARYAEIGIPEDLAERLLDSKLASVAEQLGMGDSPENRIVKLAIDRLEKLGMAREQAGMAVVNAAAKLARTEKVAGVKNRIMNSVRKA